MRNLGRTWSRRRDHGGATTLVAVVLGTGVLLGVGAVVVDVGEIYHEREQLQSGADAAADAVARICASGTCPTGFDAVGLARTRAGQNAKDNSSGVQVCGSGVTGIPACPAHPTGAGELTKCMGTPPARYVEVRTTTRNADGTTVLPPALARGLAGNGAYSGTTVKACARASIAPAGNVTAGEGIALTVNRCYWDVFIVAHGRAPVPQGTAATAADEIAFKLKDSQPEFNGTACDDGNQNAPGNWGWLDDANNDCRAQFTTGTTVGGAPGNGNRDECEQLLDYYRSSGQPVLLPLFDLATGHGQNASYRIVGFAALVVTGYYLTSGNVESNLSLHHLCNTGHGGNSERCVYGYFRGVEFTSGVTAAGGGTNFGATAPGGVKLVG